MKTLSVLYVDDQPQGEIIHNNINNLKEIFQYLGYNVEIKFIADTKSIKQTVMSSYYDVFVCDVTLRSEIGSFKYGIAIMHQIKLLIPNLIVIGISGEDVKFDEISQYLPNFDLFINKLNLWEPEYKKYIAHQFSTFFKSNVSVDISLDESCSEEDKKLVSSNSFRRLLKTILFTTHPVSNNAFDYADIQTAKLKRMTGGFSASKVYRLICTSKGETIINSVIKYTETPVGEVPTNRTEKEVNNYLNYVKWYLPYTWRPEVLAYAFGKTDPILKENKKGSQKENGIICYSFAYDDDVLFESLTDSIRQNRLDKVHVAIDKIFSGKSKKWYSESNKNIVQKPLAQYYRDLYFAQGSRPVDILNDLVQQYGGRVENNGNYNINAKDYPKINKLFTDCPITSYYTHICHGDLNSNNVIINENDDLIFIDFQDTGISQVYYDFIVFELCLKLYFPDEISLQELIDMELNLHNNYNNLPEKSIWVEMKNVREKAFENSPSEKRLCYNYGLAMRAFRLLRSINLTDVEKRRLLACLLANLKILYGNK